MPFVAAAMQVALRVAQQPSGFAQAPQAKLAAWLDARHLTYGVGDYWTTQMIKAITRDRVVADPVIFDGARLIPFRWISDVSRFDQHRPPQFVAYRTANLFGITPALVVATFGKPAKVYRLGDYAVAQYATPGVAPQPDITVQSE